MAKKISTISYSPGSITKRPGIHSKAKSSKIKTSKNYKKKYNGQGR